VTKVLIASDRPWTDSLRLSDSFVEENEILWAKNEAHLISVLEAVSDIELIFFPYWSKIIDSKIYSSFECVIFHMTDLPFGRGGSPLQNLILRGETTTKLSALQCGGEIDGGPIYMKRDLSLSGSAQDIYLRSIPIIADMIEDITRDRPIPFPQSGTPTLFRRRRPSESELPRNLSQSEIYDFIRMHDAEGYPRAFIRWGNCRIEFSNATLSEGSCTASSVITVNVQS
jgi:methionyl-tRNA formyltransferase